MRHITVDMALGTARDVDLLILRLASDQNMEGKRGKDNPGSNCEAKFVTPPAISDEVCEFVNMLL